MVKSIGGLFRRYCIPLFLVSGTLTVVVSKLCFTLTSHGIGNIDGMIAEKKFQKPWLMNWSMFLGQTPCLVLFLLSHFSSPVGERPQISRKLFVVILVPTICDLISTFMMFVGLLWISSSIWQMMRGSIILFTAALRICYRHKPLWPNEWVGTLTVII